MRQTVPLEEHLKSDFGPFEVPRLKIPFDYQEGDFRVWCRRYSSDRDMGANHRQIFGRLELDEGRLGYWAYGRPIHQKLPRHGQLYCRYFIGRRALDFMGAREERIALYRGK